MQKRHDKWAAGISRDEWVARVEAIQGESLRTKVAAIVWWDHIASGINNKPSGLDKYVKTWEAITKGESVEPSVLFDALLSIGYPEGVALKRVDPTKRYSNAKDFKFQCDSRLLRPVGADGVLYAVVTQAVDDVKNLISQGVIVNGKVNPAWPPKDNVNGVMGYHAKSEVDELIHFFCNDEMPNLLEGLGTTVDMDEVREAVGLVAS